MRLQLKAGDLVRNQYTGELFVVVSQGYDYCEAHNSKGREVRLKKWDLELYNGLDKWITHKDLVFDTETLLPTWRK